MPIDALISGGDGGMGHDRRVFNQTFNAAQAFGQRKEFAPFEKPARGLQPPLHDSRHDAPETIHLASGNAMLWMGFKARIVDLFNMRVAFEELSNLGSALTMLAHAQWQGLKGAQHPK